MTATDDGINTVGAATAASRWASGGTGQAGAGGQTGDYPLSINGGYVVVDALGDGIDANGPVDMTGARSSSTARPQRQRRPGLHGLVHHQRRLPGGGGQLRHGPGSRRLVPQRVAGLGLPTRSRRPSSTSRPRDGADMLTFVPTKHFATAGAVVAPTGGGRHLHRVHRGYLHRGAMDGLYADGTYTPGTEAGTFTVVTGAPPGRRAQRRASSTRPMMIVPRECARRRTRAPGAGPPGPRVPPPVCPRATSRARSAWPPRAGQRDHPGHCLGRTAGPRRAGGAPRRPPVPSRA